MKRYQIFISSTFEDLKEERSVVAENILKLDHIPAGMELFVASTDEQFNYIKRVIDDSDYYVLIVGNRYGSMDSSGVSYTEKEYDYAISIGLPVLVFLHGDPNSLSVKKSESDPKIVQKLHDFRDKVKKNRMVSFWDSIQSLTNEVYASLDKAFKLTPRLGWVRYSKDIDERSKNCEFSFDYTSVYQFCGEMLPKAMNSVFISGVGMTIFNSIVYMLPNVSASSIIDLAVPDLSNENVVRSLTHFFGMSSLDWDMRRNLFSEILGKVDSTVSGGRPISMIFLDMFVPVSFVAIDYLEETEFSCIQAFHYLLHKSRNDWQSYLCTVRPSHVMYERYRNQVMAIRSSEGRVAKTFT